MKWLLLFASVAFAQNQCYYAAGKRAGSAIVPCSSEAQSACCQIGDLCLADSACWNPTYNVTYLYGCTDSSYTNVNCPFKCGPDFADAPYVGLDYCANTTRNEWSCTHPPSNDPAIAKFRAQQCLNDSIIAFAGPSSLQPILSLPTNIGGSTVYFSQVNPTSYTPVPGYTPTSTPEPTASVPSSVELVSSTASATSSSTSGRSRTASATSAGVSATSTPIVSSSSGLSTGAKAGIGAGVGGAALAIAAIVIAWMVLRRRKPAPVVKDAEDPVTYSYEKRPVQTGPTELPSVSKGPTELPDAESMGTPAPTYSSWTRPQPGQQVHELPAESTRPELDVPNTPTVGTRSTFS